MNVWRKTRPGLARSLPAFLVALVLVPGSWAAECPSDDPLFVDCWLQQNPAVANAISWEVAHYKFKKWADWEPWRKRDLRLAFRAARKWYAGGLVNWEGRAVQNPPPNKELLYTQEPEVNVLDEKTAAWPLYVAHVAFSLAADIDDWVPWALADYSPEALGHLLTPGPFNMFKRDSDAEDFYDTQYPGGYIPIQRSTPTHPTLTFKFLKSRNLIGATPIETIGRVLHWSRLNLVHYLGGASGGKNNAYVCHWQYRAPAPPVSRVLYGTIGCPDTVFPGTHQHFTAGCPGTAGLYAWLLRVVNIPARSLLTCGHTAVHFSGANLYLSHGDDPYDGLSKALESPTSLRYYNARLLLITATKWKAWFGTPEATCHNAGGRRPIELAAQRYPYSAALMAMYCDDVEAGLSHADGTVYDLFEPYYSVAALEALDLWGRLANAVSANPKYSACAELDGE